jgi:hypothetical protein
MNMKKRILLAVSVCALVALFSACDSKLCYCYENGYETEMYVSSDVACGAYSTTTRGCVESNERMNPGDIAYK